jgi:hypothetical protein
MGIYRTEEQSVYPLPVLAYGEQFSDLAAPDLRDTLPRAYILAHTARPVGR